MILVLGVIEKNIFNKLKNYFEYFWVISFWIKEFGNSRRLSISFSPPSPLPNFSGRLDTAF